jgi:hypothetical protein
MNDYAFPHALQALISPFCSVTEIICHIDTYSFSSERANFK